MFSLIPGPRSVTVDSSLYIQWYTSFVCKGVLVSLDGRTVGVRGKPPKYTLKLKLKNPYDCSSSFLGTSSTPLYSLSPTRRG